MKRIKITLLAICLIVSGVSQFCAPANPSADLLDIGKITLVRRNGAREHCFNLPVKYNIPNTGRAPDIALTTKFMGYNTRVAALGFDFTVSGARKDLTNTIDINVQINEDVRWTSMQVNYLVSSNPNIAAGTFIGSLVGLTSCGNSDSNNSTATVQTFIPFYRFNKNLNYRVAAFISGFRTSDNSFSLRTLNSVFDSTEGRIAVRVQSNAVPSQQYVYIAYVLFPTTTVDNIDFSFGTVNQDQANNYRLEGALSFLETGGIQYNQFTMCRRQQGCLQGQVLLNGKCQCSQGFIKVNEVCRQLCTQNGYFNDQGQCTCIPGFQFGSNGICQQGGVCRQNQILRNGVCICQPGFEKNRQGQCKQTTCNAPNEVLNINGVCDCDYGYTRNNQGTCVSRCGQNQMWNANSCVCVQGYVFNAFRQCVLQQNICNENEVFQNNACQCKPGFSRNRNGVCTAQSVCPPGFSLNSNGMCFPNCGLNEEFNTSTGACQCTSGLVKINNVCTSRCNNNEIWDGRRCNCAAGLARINSVCRSCPPNSQVSSNGLSCDCLSNFVFRSDGQLSCRPCPQNSIAQNNQCQCNQGLVLNADQTACVRTQQCQNGVVGRNGVCTCNVGFRLNNGRCTSICPSNFQFSPQYGACIPSNVVNCTPNASVVNGACVCNFGFMRNTRDNTCMACPSNSSPRAANICDCNPGFQWSQNGQTCVRTAITCPANSTLSSQGQCVCNAGYQFTPNRQACLPTIICPQNAFIGPDGKCVCNNGYYLQSNICKVVPTCPTNMAFDQTKLTCVCKNQGQYFINGACRACSNNQYWNTTDCVCKDKLFRINGNCITCHASSTYNGTDCECNIGFYGTRDNCQLCHLSCGKCTGPQANQCITCADISYQLSKGYCTKSTCTVGYYVAQTGACEKCSDYCIYCVSQLQCAECSPGFKIKLDVIDGLGYSHCQAQCGDGKKVDFEQCDDGNLKNGDGCNSNCTVESGWFCSNGSALKPSKCVTPIPAQSKIIIKYAVNMNDKVVQGVRLSFIPKCFTDLDCQDCYKILDVKVNQANVVPSIVVSYIINSDGQFLIEYRIRELTANIFFNYTIQLNRFIGEKYENCFTQADLAQQFTGVIDSSTLAIADNTDQLTFEDVQAPQPQQAIVPTTTIGQASGGPVNGYPQRVIDLIFRN